MRAFMPLILTASVTFLGTGPSTQLNGQQADTIVDVAVAAGSFETLAAALGAANLVDALRGEGPFTVFAPNDAAFRKLPDGAVAGLLEPGARAQLQQVLTYHVVPGRYDARQLLEQGQLSTLQGEQLRFAIVGGRLTVNGVAISNNDVVASNGVIHVIDQVLLPPQAETPAAARAGEQLLLLAIERGVPLFNAGQREACAAVYEVAVQAMVDFNQELSGELRETLRGALRTVRSTADASENAWTLRRAMDHTLRRLQQSASATGESATRPVAVTPEASVFEFTSKEESERWFTVNDDVMGGISRAGMGWSKDGSALFRGQLSLENNGGFATVRCALGDVGLAGYDGIVMRVRGDGRTYGLSGMKTGRRMDVNTWTKRFATRAGEWQEVRIPFRDLEHTVMGRRVPGSGPLSAEDLRSISFIIADKSEEPFQLEIDWIRSYRDNNS
ncbi:MAG: CIA30 family protein [Planctomycetota bacterium]